MNTNTKTLPRSTLLNILLGRNAQQHEHFIKQCFASADSETAVLAAMLRDKRSNLWELTRQVACVLRVDITDDLPHVKPMRQELEWDINQWSCDLHDVIKAARELGYMQGCLGRSA